MKWDKRTSPGKDRSGSRTKIVRQDTYDIKKPGAKIEEMASQQLPIIRNAAIAVMHAAFDDEFQRLLTLQKRNPAIRDEEVQAMCTKISDLEKRLQSTSLKLSALRAMFT